LRSQQVGGAAAAEWTVCDVSDRHAIDSLRNKKARSGFPAGAIRTVDFLLHHSAAAVKKLVVKTHDGSRRKFSTSCPAQAGHPVRRADAVGTVCLPFDAGDYWIARFRGQ
jgi:hypothetical protein